MKSARLLTSAHAHCVCLHRRDGRMWTMSVDQADPSVVIAAFSNLDVNQLDADDRSLWIGGSRDCNKLL